MIYFITAIKFILALLFLYIYNYTGSDLHMLIDSFESSYNNSSHINHDQVYALYSKNNSQDLTLYGSSERSIPGSQSSSINPNSNMSSGNRGMSISSILNPNSGNQDMSVSSILNPNDNSNELPKNTTGDSNELPENPMIDNPHGSAIGNLIISGA